MSWVRVPDGPPKENTLPRRRVFSFYAVRARIVCGELTVLIRQSYGVEPQMALFGQGGTWAKAPAKLLLLTENEPQTDP